MQVYLYNGHKMGGLGHGIIVPGRIVFFVESIFCGRTFAGRGCIVLWYVLAQDR